MDLHIFGTIQWGCFILFLVGWGYFLRSTSSSKGPWTSGGAVASSLGKRGEQPSGPSTVHLTIGLIWFNRYSNGIQYTILYTYDTLW